MANDLDLIRVRHHAYDIAPYDDKVLRSFALVSDVPKLVDEVEHLRRIVAMVTALTRGDEGDALDPDTDLPVGVFQQALAGDPGALG